MVVAALLRVMAAAGQPITDDDICWEFSLSEGTDVDRIKQSLAGLGVAGSRSGAPPAWLRGVDTAKLTQVIGGGDELVELRYVRGAVKTLHGLAHQQQHLSEPFEAALLRATADHAAREVQLVKSTQPEGGEALAMPLAAALAKQGWALQAVGDHAWAVQTFDAALALRPKADGKADGVAGLVGGFAAELASDGQASVDPAAAKHAHFWKTVARQRRECIGEL